MLKKIRFLTNRYAVVAVFIVFIVLDLLVLGLGRLLRFLPETLPMDYLTEIILMLVPAAFVVFFGFSSAFKKGNFLRGLLCILPFLAAQLIMLAVFFLENLQKSDVSWKPWYLIAYGVFSIVGVAVREECIYRATLQNIVAKKYANSVKGIWITAIVGAIIFGLMHSTNIFFGMDPGAVVTQVISSTFFGLLLGAVYLRSGSLWALIVIHTVTDLLSLSASTFLNVDTIADMSETMAWSWSRPFAWLFYIAFAAFLLRPSKCKQICQSLCFAGEESDEDPCV